MGYGVHEIVVVPCAFFDAMADGYLGAVDALEDVSGDAIDECDVGRRIVFTGPIVVLTMCTSSVQCRAFSTCQ